MLIRSVHQPEQNALFAPIRWIYDPATSSCTELRLGEARGRPWESASFSADGAFLSLRTWHSYGGRGFRPLDIASDVYTADGVSVDVPFFSTTDPFTGRPPARSSLAWAPSGSMAAIAGEVYDPLLILDAATGSVVETEYPSSSSAWSPSATYVRVYGPAGQLFVVGADGSLAFSPPEPPRPEEPARGEWAALTDRLAYGRCVDGACPLEVVDFRTGQTLALGSTPVLAAASIEWSPGDRWLSFAVCEAGACSLGLADPARPGSVRLFPSIAPWNLASRWSPADDAFAVRAHDTRRFQIFALDDNMVPADLGVAMSLAWSPSGEALAVIRPPDGTGRPLLQVIDDRSGSQWRSVRLPSLAAGTDSVREPVWSPDGTRVATAAGGELHVLSREGSSARRKWGTDAVGIAMWLGNDRLMIRRSGDFWPSEFRGPAMVVTADLGAVAAISFEYGSLSPDGTTLAGIPRHCGGELRRSWWPGLVTYLVAETDPRAAERVQPKELVDCARHGGPGDDVLVGRALYGGDGDDRLTPAPGGLRSLFARGGRGDDVLIGGFRDYLDGGLGDDVIRGSGGRDRLVGGPGDDLLRGGPGTDRLDGGSGRDVLVGDGDPDRIYGGRGSDFLDAGRGRPGSQVTGGKNELWGGAGRDVLVSRGRGDQLHGGLGDDTIRARDGRRTMVDCGPGRDRAFVDRFDRVKNCEVVRRAKRSASA